MSLRYIFDNNQRLLHITADGPSSIGDYEDVVPDMLQEISDKKVILLLMEIHGFVLGDRPQDHDLAFFLVNEINSQVAKCAFVCSREQISMTQELAHLLEKQGHPTGTFDSSIMARNWLFAQVWSWPMVLTVLSH
jgi:hypothetical protein